MEINFQDSGSSSSALTADKEKAPTAEELGQTF